jgi:hypothetical protein
VAFVELLGHVYAFLSVFELIWRFVQCPCVGDEVKCACDGDDVKCPYVGDDCLFSTGTLTCIKSLAKMFETVVPPYPNESQ